MLRLVRQSWRRIVSFGEGVLFLFLAVVIGSCLFDGEECDSAELDSMPNYDYIEEVKRLRSESADEAKQLAQYIFETEGMPNQEEARRIYDEIDAEQKNWWNRTKRVASGFVLGEGGSIEELGGSVASDMFLYGDVRDLIKQSYYKVTENEKGDAFILALSFVGIATEVINVVDWVPAVLKAFRKIGALSSKMVGFLTDGLKKIKATKKVDGVYMSLFSSIKSLTDSLGFARAGVLMRHADTAADVAAMAKVAKVVPNETYLLVKYSGKAGVKELGNLTDAQVMVLREAAKKGPDALKNVKKYLDELKSRTTLARRLARIVKSWRAGHLSGFIVKLIQSRPFLRFVFGGLSLILIGLAGWKFWLAVKAGVRFPRMTEC